MATTVNEQWQSVASSANWVKSLPQSGSKNVGLIYKGDIVNVDQIGGYNNYWLHHSKGWTCMKDYDGTVVMKKISTIQPTPVPAAAAPAVIEETETVSVAMDTNLSSVYQNYDQYVNTLTEGGIGMKNLRGIHGLPYQYMSVADTKTSSRPDAIGRKYSEKIVAKMPLLLMTAGVPEFLANYSLKDKKTVLERIMGMAAGQAFKNDLDQLINGDGRYYTLKYDYTSYYSYVNPMCRSAAYYLGIEDRVLDGIQLKNYSWYKDTIGDLSKIIPSTGTTAFYINSDTQITDNFSNSTTASQLASTTDGISDMGRELNFLLGTAGSNIGKSLDKFTSAEELATNQELLQKEISKVLGADKGNLFKNIASNVQTLAAGGKLVFPEIWSDSSFSRSYSINIKLTSPDCDPFSLYLNILVPLYHLMAFILPRQAGVNGFISPFLIRACYKGMFNCNMGIITDMSISKGEEGGWTKEGLPTSVEVSFTIKDLYDSLYMTSQDDNSLAKGLFKSNFMNNIAMMDYIANMCGVNINEPDVARTIEMFYTMNVTNKITDTVKLNMYGGLEQWCTNMKRKIFEGFLR